MNRSKLSKRKTSTIDEQRNHYHLLFHEIILVNDCHYCDFFMWLHTNTKMKSKKDNELIFIKIMSNAM